MRMSYWSLDRSSSDLDGEQHQEGDDLQGNVAAEVEQQAHRRVPWTSRPVGRKIRTRAIIRNMAPSTNSGKPTLPIERVMPRSRAARKAPGIEPMPPITVTMKLSTRMPRPMPGVSERTGAASAPAPPARAPPGQVGRASRGARARQYGEISAGASSVK